jgi:Phage Mu protein F like protein
MTPADPRRLATALRRFLLRQRGEVLVRLRAGATQAPPLGHWARPMAEALAPYLAPYLVAGGLSALTRIARLVSRRRKSADPLGIAFDLVNPRVAEAVRRLVFDFCQEALSTSTMRVDEALDELRAGLAGGLDRGEALKRLSARVSDIFGDPQRAFMIAATEASRATHAGQLLAAEESGVVGGLRWLSSSDCCDACAALDGRVVRLGEPFAVTGGKAAYATVLHPPLHPHCMCSVTEVLDADM